MLSRPRKAWDLAGWDQVSGLQCLNFRVSVAPFPLHSTTAVAAFLQPDPHHTFLCYCHKCQLISRRHSAAPQDGEERVGGLSGLLASLAVSSRAGGPGHQECFDVAAFVATQRRNPVELLAQKWGLTHREELMFFRETGGNMILKKSHKSQWVHSSITVRLCLLNLLPCSGQPQTVKHILPKRQVCTLGPAPISAIPHGVFPPKPGVPGTAI